MRMTTGPLLLLTIHAVYGQLNFEGNPLTEDTVYTAEESHFTEKTAKPRSLAIPETEDSYLLAAKALQAERAQNQYKSSDAGKNRAQLPLRNEISSAGSPSANLANFYETLPNDIPKESPAPASNAVFGTQTFEAQYYKKVETQDQVYPVNQKTPIPQISNPSEYYKKIDSQDQAYPVTQEAPNPEESNPSESALMMFLNSKTPQESRIALEEYLNGDQGESQIGTESSAPYQPHISEIILPQQQSIVVDQQMNQIGQMDARYSQSAQLAYPNSQSLYSPGSPDPTSFPVNQRAGQSSKGPVLNRGPPPLYGRRSFSVRPPYKGPIYRSQSRIGSIPGLRKVSHGPYGPGSSSPEIIYTKPPGYGDSQYERGKNPYEDASAWFPDANYPPPDVNVYHSQLYAQSYDPYYYNYIAKYGKIKPHLYGKFNKKKEGFLSELFHSFKKYGMKHVMHPMFLLGLGIPMVTLMLSALISQRSLGRSSSGFDAGDLHVTNEEIDEWITKLRKALECYQQSASESDQMKCEVSD